VGRIEGKISWEQDLTHLNEKRRKKKDHERVSPQEGKEAFQNPRQARIKG
jgi:hypothetical protein